jgi:hypothetical protein
VGPAAQRRQPTHSLDHPGLLPLARAIFAGQIGYEAPSAVLSAGELDEVIKAVAGKPA